MAKLQTRVISFLSAMLVAVLTMAAFIYPHYLSPSFSYHKPAQAAFVISFDDQYVKEWYQHRSLFKRYGVRATFFITKPDSLTAQELTMLKALAVDGHEIGSHGAHHVNSLQNIEAYGLPQYIQHEVIPSIKALQAHGFTPVTFAYPYGASSRYTDHELSKYFYLLRGDSWKARGKGVEDLDRIFYDYDGRRVINGLGIDNGSGVTLQDIEAAFSRAAQRKEAVVLYAHAINTSNHSYAISPAMLESIFRLARQKRLTSLSFKDLAF